MDLSEFRKHLEKPVLFIVKRKIEKIKLLLLIHQLVGGIKYTGEPLVAATLELKIPSSENPREIIDFSEQELSSTAKYSFTGWGELYRVFRLGGIGITISGRYVREFFPRTFYFNYLGDDLYEIVLAGTNDSLLLRRTN